MLGNRKVC